MQFRAFLDANVLVGARERDVLLTLGEADLFDPLWSGGAIEEMLRHLPTSMDVAARSALLDSMNRAFPEADVRWDHGVVVEVQQFINSKDHHIVASALWGHADVLVTNDAALRAEVERSGLIDPQASAEFVAYAIDVDVKAATEALVSMVRDRWMPGLTDLPDAAVLARLSSWMDRGGWRAAAGIVEQVAHRL
ncbi:hypothetical protein GCM10027052_25860 [Parafrigoribacterium mesophilum]|uniref:hypothetical protein n=1 Tax=Parafrigoribacterium mesophilum TaxID=433646 RepID=UPI0031FCF84B